MQTGSPDTHFFVLLLLFLGMWRNWQTRRIQNPVSFVT